MQYAFLYLIAQPYKRVQFIHVFLCGDTLLLQYEVKDGDQLQNGFVLLAPGATIAVKPLWLHATLASVSKKKRKNNKETKSAEVIKKLIDGFFEPWDLAIKGGTKAFSENPIFKSLRCKKFFFVLSAFCCTSISN